MSEKLELRDRLIQSIRLACEWLTEIAQVKHAKLSDDPRRPTTEHHYEDWRGAIKGEYSHAERRWWFFCPIWHTGQAVRSLAQAHRLLGDPDLLDSAKFSADFILRQRITDPADEDYGLILAYEDLPDKPNTSAIMEALPGLIELHQITGEETYLTASKDALDWVVKKAFMADLSLMRDMYDPKARRFIDEGFGVIGRPLVEDAVLLIVGRLTNDDNLIEIHYKLLERLIRDEDPPGNWIKYPPANAKLGNIHPRHAYWWGMPFIDGFLETKDERYLQIAIRAGEWYVKAQRADGGLFRATFRDSFNTESFGHATSGIACAVKMWVRLRQITGDDHWLEPISKALRFCLNMQMTSPADEDLRGVIVEKILPPDGTDRSPIHVRDLGTIFYIQAACDVLSAELDKELTV